MLNLLGDTIGTLMAYLFVSLAVLSPALLLWGAIRFLRDVRRIADALSPDNVSAHSKVAAQLRALDRRDPSHAGTIRNSAFGR